MEDLDNLVSEIIARILKPDEFVFQLIESKLRAVGVNLSEEQKLQIKEDLRQNNFNGFFIHLSEEQEKKFADSNDGHLVLDLVSQEELDSLESKLQRSINQATQETIELVSSSLLEGWKSQAPLLLNLQERERLNHAQLIDRVWSKPLNLLEILLSVSLEAGARFNEYYRASAVEEKDFVFEAVTRLHARGCQVGAEALLLLKNGFADGAHARWRTLHEICVEAWFILNNGNNVAEQFLCHSVISDSKMAISYKEHHKTLGYFPPKQEEIDTIMREKDEMLRRFGSCFQSDYGWAAQSLKKSRPTFLDLEKSVGLEYLRPFYKLANLNVHSGSKGASFRLGSPSDGNDILVVGPSIFGLGEPGQNIAFSFHLLTRALLLTKENLDRIAFIFATDQLKDETIWAFDEVMEAQEKNIAIT